MIEQQVVVTRVEVNRNTVLQDSRHDRVRRGGYKLVRQVGEERTVAGLEGFPRRMNGFLD